MRLVVNIDVDDLDKAIRFYSAGLGLTPGRRLFEGSVAEMLGAGSTVHLLAKSPDTATSPGSSAARDYARHWTPVHLDFEVADIEAAVDRAVRAGATLEAGIQSYAWGRLATMSDPFGHGFCLVQFVGSGYDTVAAPDARR